MDKKKNNKENKLWDTKGKKYAWMGGGIAAAVLLIGGGIYIAANPKVDSVNDPNFVQNINKKLEPVKSSSESQSEIAAKNKGKTAEQLESSAEKEREKEEAEATKFSLDFDPASGKMKKLDTKLSLDQVAAKIKAQDITNRQFYINNFKGDNLQIEELVNNNTLMPQMRKFLIQWGVNQSKINDDGIYKIWARMAMSGTNISDYLNANANALQKQFGKAPSDMTYTWTMK